MTSTQRSLKRYVREKTNFEGHSKNLNICDQHIFLYVGHASPTILNSMPLINGQTLPLSIFWY